MGESTVRALMRQSKRTLEKTDLGFFFQINIFSCPESPAADVVGADDDVVRVCINHNDDYKYNRTFSA